MTGQRICPAAFPILKSRYKGGGVYGSTAEGSCGYRAEHVYALGLASGACVSAKARALTKGRSVCSAVDSRAIFDFHLSGLRKVRS
ncbi:hypothetical protein EJ03DRAFT_51073 [Teratosphaeria nubilosa]|uniref:Uncharacterized protein n=1 Tax=Teratosphaeria nubilosa TaxID=161662 RepID=A0A6G1LE99_9PEZI|nr:hypothetical protein EJ03DRAFT_51073 [Teratosphaeria nubilosa]